MSLSEQYMNIAPLLPGHSLVVPKRHVESFLELDGDQLGEMFKLARAAIPVLGKAFGLEGFNLVIQEGVAAGQTVKHLHLHILPRKLLDMGEDPRRYFFELLDSNNQREGLSEVEMTEVVAKIKASL